MRIVPLYSVRIQTTIDRDFGCCFCHRLGRYLLLCSTMSTKEHRIRAVYQSSDSYDETHDRTSASRPGIGARSIVPSSGPLHYLKTLALLYKSQI